VYSTGSGSAKYFNEQQVVQRVVHKRLFPSKWSAAHSLISRFIRKFQGRDRFTLPGVLEHVFNMALYHECIPSFDIMSIKIFHHKAHQVSHFYSCLQFIPDTFRMSPKSIMTATTPFQIDRCSLKICCLYRKFA
jgi:hypothetical protein